jgi:Uncharacterised protein family (UPF0262)
MENATVHGLLPDVRVTVDSTMLIEMPTIRIDEDLWRGASSLRKHEWRVLIGDLTRDDSPWPSRSGSTIVIGNDVRGIRVSAMSPNGERESFELPHSEIGAELREYMAVIERLGEDGMTTARAEALDMAKRVVHDKAALRIGTLLPDVSPNLETRRRLFSLLVTIVVDTTGKRIGHAVR